MKLLSKFNRVNILATIIVLLLSGICYYFLIRAILVQQLDNDLTIEEREITDFAKENNRLPEPSDDKDEQEFFFSSVSVAPRELGSIHVFNRDQHTNTSYRQLQFYINVSGKGYKVLIRKSQQEMDDLIKFILKITFLLLVVLLVALFVINRFILSKLWRPFQTTLQQINLFNLSGKNKMQLEQTDVNEFAELNTAVSIMINRVIKDYNEIKSFTENASHEIQTPLAIIKSKLELLSQSENLKEEQMNTVQSIYEAVNRLSKLNQSLILLTKIGNRQFSENEEVKLGSIINNNIAYYEELTGSRSIAITKNSDGNVTVTMNEMLAEILISNLITNAIKHNVDKGTMEIRLKNKQLVISNSGIPLNCDPLEMFERFKKDKVSSESLGLGLSIVKKICERYYFSINYAYADLLHTITIDF